MYTDKIMLQFKVVIAVNDAVKRTVTVNLASALET